MIRWIWKLLAEYNWYRHKRDERFKIKYENYALQYEIASKKRHELYKNFLEESVK